MATSWKCTWNGKLDGLESISSNTLVTEKLEQLYCDWNKSHRSYFSLFATSILLGMSNKEISKLSFSDLTKLLSKSLWLSRCKMPNCDRLVQIFSKYETNRLVFGRGVLVASKPFSISVRHTAVNCISVP